MSRSKSNTKSTSSGSSTRSSRPAKRGKKKPKKQGSFFGRLFRRLVYLAIAGIIVGGLGLAGAIWYYGRDLPDVASLRNYEPPEISRVVDRNGDVIGEIFAERRTVIPLDQIPRSLILCTLAAEDADFYEHEGLDYPGIARAVFRYVQRGGEAREGASTITMQVVKLLLLGSERTFERKLRQMILARRLEQELSKDEILHLYLNHINYGHGRYGVQEAAQFYFGKDAQDLNLAEASAIAGIPQTPSRLSLRTHRENALRRQRFILTQLEEKRDQYWPDLTVDQIEQARETEIDVVEREVRQSAPEIMRHVRRELREIVGDDEYRRGGFVVETSLDLALQEQTRSALRSGLEAIDARHRRQGALRIPRRAPDRPDVERLRVGGTYLAIVSGTDDEEGMIYFNARGHRAAVPIESAARYNPEGLSASEFAPNGATVRISVLEIPEAEEGEETVARAHIERGTQGAVVVLDPRTRDVLALVGGYERGPGFDRARQARRQPGSTFKPIVYSAGIRSGQLTPATIMIDAPAVYDQWQPQNYESWRHSGPIRLRDALARSVNVVAVRAIETVGPEHVVSFARDLGIESELEPTLALALGASAVTPMEMTNAYATFAAGGRWEQSRLIRSIRDREGNEVELPGRASARDVLTPAEAYVTTRMLQGVTQRGGTAARAGRLEIPVAGKTGTSNNAKDAWFVGFSADVVTGVWVGFDDNRPIGRRESGGRSALPIWIEVMRAASRGRRPVEFPRPSGVVELSIDPVSGNLAYEGQEDAIDEVFVEGRAPTERALPPEVADSNTFLLEQFQGGFGAPEPAPSDNAGAGENAPDSPEAGSVEHAPAAP